MNEENEATNDDIGIGVTAIFPIASTSLVLEAQNSGRGDLVIRFNSGELVSSIIPSFARFIEVLQEGEQTYLYTGVAGEDIRIGITSEPFNTDEKFSAFCEPLRKPEPPRELRVLPFNFKVHVGIPMAQPPLAEFNWGNTGMLIGTMLVSSLLGLAAGLSAEK